MDTNHLPAGLRRPESRRLGSRLLVAAILSAGSHFALPAQATARDLTFADRVEAQRAIEKVYFAHRAGSSVGPRVSPRFEEAIPESLLVEKVRTYLAQSVALEEFWKTPVTEAMLRGEEARMVAGSRMPERLRELRASLGGDDRLFAETLARATLVDRLCRQFLASDTRVDTHDWDTWWRAARARFDPLRARTVIEETAPGTGTAPAPGTAPPAAAPFAAASTGAAAPATVASGAPACVLQDLWSAGHDDVIPGSLGGPLVWTGSEVISWGPPSHDGMIQTNGRRYDPATDTWRPMSTVGAPAPRGDFTSVWTGKEIIIWGGTVQGTVGTQHTNTGGRYDPVTDTWTPTSMVNAATPTSQHVAAWTGSVMVVAGGWPEATAGRYDPRTDTWAPISMDNAPGPRMQAGVVWTGTEMIVWSGGPFVIGGARYNPVTDAWTPVSTINSPHVTELFSTIWTGSEMIVFGGGEGGFNPGAGRYNPLTDTWTPISLVGAPANRWYHSAIWTGREMIVWGGRDWSSNATENNPLITGGRYDPATDTWQATSTVNAPASLGAAQAVWTGDLMVACGGSMSDGGRYSPASDSWTPTFTAKNWPDPAGQPLSVWTGTEFIVWSGPGQGASARYDPALDTWNAVRLTGAPSLRFGATAVWAGRRMVIWGGEDANGTPLDTGGRYDPAADAWAPTSREDVWPSARTGHTAIGTGTEMIVWGGKGPGGPLADGARYQPGGDRWTPLPPDGAPASRSAHSAIWTGTEMIVWGGDVGGGTGTSTGGRFDPAANGGDGAWTATSTAGAPAARFGQTAVWTGSKMVVWGGTQDASGTQDSSGGRYDAATDTWSLTSLSAAPSPRSHHTAVWTGEKMIVWGGHLLTSQSFTPWATGGVYDPVSDLWSPTSMINAPAARYDHAAAWTGSAMLVWGGSQALGGLAFHDRIVHWYGNVGADPSADGDLDGVAACFDCDDRNPAAWGVPGEVAGLVLGADAATVSWSSPPSPGAVSVIYDLLRSDAASDFTTQGLCLASGVADTSAVDAQSPDLGAAFFYLVRARNACPGGVGTLGSNSAGVPRATPICP